MIPVYLEVLLYVNDFILSLDPAAAAGCCTAQ